MSRSNSVTSNPSRASNVAAVAPAGPPPTTSTWVVFTVMRSLSSSWVPLPCAGSRNSPPCSERCRPSFRRNAIMVSLIWRHVPRSHAYRVVTPLLGSSWARAANRYASEAPLPVRLPHWVPPLLRPFCAGLAPFCTRRGSEQETLYHDEAPAFTPRLQGSTSPERGRCSLLWVEAERDQVVLGRARRGDFRHGSSRERKRMQTHIGKGAEQQGDKKAMGQGTDDRQPGQDHDPSGNRLTHHQDERDGGPHVEVGTGGSIHPCLEEQDNDQDSEQARADPMGELGRHAGDEAGNDGPVAERPIQAREAGVHMPHIGPHVDHDVAVDDG